MNFATLQKAQASLKKKAQPIDASRFLENCSRSHNLIEYAIQGMKPDLYDSIKEIEYGINIENCELKLTAADLLEL